MAIYRDKRVLLVQDEHDCVGFFTCNRNKRGDDLFNFKLTSMKFRLTSVKVSSSVPHM